MDTRPALILCMAGVYRRFREAGYTTPKFLLPVPRGTVLGWIVEELRPDRLLLVANARDRAHEAAIRAAVPRSTTLVWIGDTGGQAETAAIGVERLAEQGFTGPLLLHNVDTVVIGRDLDGIGRSLASADGWIDVFDSDSPKYSYVAVEGGRVVEIAEKVVISRHATTGLYGFRSPATYLSAVRATTGRSGGEFYVSDVYRTMLARGERVVVDPDGADRATIVLGTPEEYEAWVATTR